MNIVIYTKSNCPNCTTAKQLLKSKRLEYEEKNAEVQPHLTFVISQGLRQMPQIFINGQRVGGLAGLQQAIKELGL